MFSRLNNDTNLADKRNEKGKMKQCHDGCSKTDSVCLFDLSHQANLCQLYTKL